MRTLQVSGFQATERQDLHVDAQLAKSVGWSWLKIPQRASAGKGLLTGWEGKFEANSSKSTWRAAFLLAFSNSSFISAK